MTERGLPGVDSAQACPFVAFEDDREARASTPDHRHRCYAELVPSPRAAAHQEAYCLSSAFPVCPTFQDWARREAAHARAGEGRGARPAPEASPRAATIEAIATGPDDDAEDPGGDAGPPRHAPLDAPPPVRRNPPRDWAAPPPWAPGGSGAGTAGRRAAADPSTPAFLAGREEEGRGLAGSAADRLASGSGSRSAAGTGSAGTDPESAEAPPDEELAGLVGGRRLVDLPRHDEPGRYDALPQDRGGHRPTVSSTRSSRRERERERERDAIVGPSWERARRYEAFPTIRARGGLPEVPRLALLAGALVVAAVALFFAPALLGIGGNDGGGGATAAPSTSQAAGDTSPSVEPTAPPAPTSQVYVVESGDTMSKIAKRFDLTLDELCNANKEAIPDCDKIAIGDEIVIPTRAPEEFTEPSASPS